MRLVYAIGGIYMAICVGAIALRETENPPEVRLPVLPPRQLPAVEGARVWYERMKPWCNSVEVEMAMTQHPPPAGYLGASYQAACFALAGNIGRAREIILALPISDRVGAAEIVFGVAHPVADAGDDRSAGPIMALVAEYSPANYMALYHAGMSALESGEHSEARKHLTEFLRQYRVDDQWRSNAKAALGEIR